MVPSSTNRVERTALKPQKNAQNRTGIAALFVNWWVSGQALKEEQVWADQGVVHSGQLWFCLPNERDAES